MRVETPPHTPKKPALADFDHGHDAGEGTIQDLGYRQDYRRVFKTIGNIALVFAMASPLSGYMITTYYQISYGGYWGLTWGWVLPVVLFFPQALAIAELSSSMPINGAFYWWTAALAPRHLSRPLSYMLGWFSMLTTMTSVASFAYATGSSYAALASFLNADWHPLNAQIMAIATGFIVPWVLMQLLGMERLSLAFLFLASFVVVLFFVFVIGLPVTHAKQGKAFARGSDVFGSYENFSEWPAGVAVPFTWFYAAWTVTGWPSPAFIAEETVDPSRNTPRSIIMAYCSTAGLGIVLCVITAFCIPDIETAAMDPTGFPVYTVILEHWGTKLGTAFLMVSMSTVALGGSSYLFTASSSLAAFARDGGLPASHIFERIHERTNLPLAACGLVSVGGFLILLFSLSTQAGSIIYSLAVIAIFVMYAVPMVLRITAGSRFVPGPFYLGKCSIPVHSFAILTIIYMIIMESFPTTPHWTASTFNYNWIVALCVYGCCGIMWIVVGRKAYKGPDLAALDARMRATEHCGTL
ncbi:amino acid/polyamine transporter I [Dactylonectria macrodidyma]|uniref:Amino acid/polyamine transporter I n=1 Tax=Dactylonectria macrodidyma TaxID=307937 RepID=A0A9P9DV28_9HYPO|nr:amino acid/polyamine transporter I [Dactylonectria macrodidyma]